ncbi:hypothetical protein XELAEV_18037411mg, partial [Xenopus laevis]
MDRERKGSPDPGGTQDLAQTFLKVPTASCDRQLVDRLSDGEDTGERNLGLAVSDESVGAINGSNPAPSSSLCEEMSEVTSELRPAVSTESESTSIVVESDGFMHPGATRIEAQALRPSASKTYSSVLVSPELKSLSLRPQGSTLRRDYKDFGLIPIRRKQSEAFISPGSCVAKSKMAAN